MLFSCSAEIEKTTGQQSVIVFLRAGDTNRFKPGANLISLNSTRVIQSIL